MIASLLWLIAGVFRHKWKMKCHRDKKRSSRLIFRASGIWIHGTTSKRCVEKNVGICMCAG